MTVACSRALARTKGRCFFYWSTVFLRSDADLRAAICIFLWQHLQTSTTAEKGTCSLPVLLQSAMKTSCTTWTALALAHWPSQRCMTPLTFVSTLLCVIVCSGTHYRLQAAQSPCLCGWKIRWAILQCMFLRWIKSGRVTWVDAHACNRRQSRGDNRPSSSHCVQVFRSMLASYSQTTPR